MSKTIILRLSDKEYDKISAFAESEHRPISNFITHIVMKTLEDSFYVDPVEMTEINNDKELLKRIKKAHKDAGSMKGKFVE